MTIKREEKIMKNKRLAKVFAMLLIIIVGIGGACFAENPKCAQGIHNFDIDGKDAFLCKDCGYICDENTSTFGEWGYKHEVNGRIDVNNCIRYCTNSNHDHGAKAVKWKPHKDENGDGMCDDCSYPCMNDKHNFDIDGSNGYICKDCGYNCNDSWGEWTYKDKIEGVDLDNCIRYCINSNHEHWDWRERGDTHIDEDGDGICDNCKYPCMGDTHNLVDNVCTKCTYKSSITSYKDEYGSLIIRLNGSEIKVDKMTSVELQVDGELLRSEKNINNLSKDEDNIKRIEYGKDSLWIMDGCIMYIVRQESEWASKFGATEHKVKINVKSSDNIYWQEFNIVKGCFENTKPNEEENKTELSKTGFTDVKAGIWSEDAIKFVVDKKIMNGMGDGTFNPLGNVTKAQLATIIKRVAEDKKIEIEEATGNMVVKYSDEDELASWAKEAILLVGPYIPEESGYISISPRQFGSASEVKRSQVVLALVKALALEEKVTISEATKKKIEEIKKNENIKDEKLIKAAEIVYETGIMQGDGKKLNLENKISRQEMAKTIQNLYSANLETREKCTEKGCTGYINTEWQKDDTYHWKVCSKNKNHELKMTAHTYDKDSNVCSVCKHTKEVKEEEKEEEKEEFVEQTLQCPSCMKKTKWEQTDTMHIAICTEDNSHVVRIEGHRLNSNNQCIVCGKVDTHKYSSKFVDFQDSNHWAWRNVCYMAEKGIVKGVHNELNNTYILYPNDTITAEAFVALLARVLGYEAEDKDKISNESVYVPMENPDSYWSIGEWKYLMKHLEKRGINAEEEMQILLSNNSKSGSDEEIAANYRKEITRERVAYLMGGILESNERQDVLADKFEDWGAVRSSYKERLLRLSAYDILRGELRDDGKLYVKPNDSITRVEAIALVDRLNSVLSLDYKYQKYRD